MEVVVAPEPMDYETRGMYRVATLREGAGLAEAVRDQWPVNPRLLMIAAEPESDTYTENLAMDLASSPVPMSSCWLTARGRTPMRSVRPSLASWTCRPCLRASRRALSLSRFPRRRATPSDSPAAG